MGKEDFSLIQVIGTGSYGKVILVKKKSKKESSKEISDENEKYFAMKVIKKSHIRKHK